MLSRQGRPSYLLVLTRIFLFVHPGNRPVVAQYEFLKLYAENAAVVDVLANNTLPGKLERMMPVLEKLSNIVDNIIEKTDAELEIVEKVVSDMESVKMPADAVLENQDWALRKTSKFISTYVSYGDSDRVYLYSTQRTKFDKKKQVEAEKKCEKFGGYLLELDTRKEFQMVSSYGRLIGGDYTAYGTGYRANFRWFYHIHSKNMFTLPGVKWLLSFDCIFIMGKAYTNGNCNSTVNYICEVPVQLTY